MSVEDIQNGLIQRFRQNFGSIPTAWENTAFTPPSGRLWMAVNFIPAGSKVDTLGTHGKDLEHGLFQITICIPDGSGEMESRKKINLLRTCFSPGAFVYNGQSITITSRNSGAGFSRANYWRIPFTVYWRAQIQR